MFIARQPIFTRQLAATPRQLVGHRADDRGLRSKARGSVLVPVVAAMLILLLMGVALAELFAAQRMQSTLTVDSVQAFWIAEAGVWHAGFDDTDITVPVAFAGGDYTVVQSGSDYTATGSFNQATRVVASNW